MSNQIKGGFFGAAIGDALGVPVEFSARERLKQNPVTDFRGYGVWNQPPGTFSDDSSLLFCTAESLCDGFDINDIAAQFIQWRQKGYWGAHDEVFDIGGATKYAISRLIDGVSPTLSGGMLEHDNGNGSLMRILPIAFYLQDQLTIGTRYETVKLLSGITHYHFRSVMACFIYVEFCLALLTELDKSGAYHQMQIRVNQFVKDHTFADSEMALFDRILQYSIADFQEQDIQSSGYVLDTLKSSLWCFLTSATYEHTVLKAVNLGGDTDTTGTVAGGLAGLFYGYNAIPTHWVKGLAKQEAIAGLAERFARQYESV